MSRAATTTDVFNAVGDETRRAVLAELATGEYTVGALAERLACPQAQVSKHLRVLRLVNLVTYRSEGRSRVYRIDRAGLEPLQKWLDQLAERVNSSYDRLDHYLHELQAHDDPERQGEPAWPPDTDPRQ
jgi:DNA-binding transcriptional ArsR family regulator